MSLLAPLGPVTIRSSMAEHRAFGSSGGMVPLRRGRGIEVRVDGISVTVDDGPDEGAAAILRGIALVVGRGSGNDVALTDPAVAPRHLVLTRTPEGVMAEDLGSPGGTFLGGLRIRQAFVPDGGTLRVGTTVLTVRTATTRFEVVPLAAPRIPGLVGEPPLCAPPARSCTSWRAPTCRSR